MQDGSAYTKDARGVPQAVAFQSVDHCADASTELSPTLRRHDPMAVAFEPGGLKRGTAGSQPNEHVAPTLRKEMGDNQPAVAFSAGNVKTTGHQGDTVVHEHGVWPTLPAQSANNGGGSGAILMRESAMHVRRLTPRECERLQGFPDDYTLVPYRGKPASDGPRYKALGNSMAVNCMFYIGQRIQMADNTFQAEEGAD